MTDGSVQWTQPEGALRLRLCEASAWCQSVNTAWDSASGKWLCAACQSEIDRGPMGHGVSE